MDCRVPRPGRLVVVDDDPHVLAALRFTFEADGCEVFTLASGEDLIKQPSPAGIDCIIIDERLSGQSGLDTLAQLRAAGVTTPAILITTHPSFLVRRRAAKLAVDIVEKPLIGDELSQRVSALMSR